MTTPSNSLIRMHHKMDDFNMKGPISEVNKMAESEYYKIKKTNLHRSENT